MVATAFTFLSSLLLALIASEQIPVPMKIAFGIFALVLLALAMCPVLERAATALRSPNVAWLWGRIGAGVVLMGYGLVRAAKWVCSKMTTGRSAVDHWVEVVYLSLMQAIFFLTALCGGALFAYKFVNGLSYDQSLIALATLVVMLALLRKWIDLNVQALLLKQPGQVSQVLLLPANTAISVSLTTLRRFLIGK